MYLLIKSNQRNEMHQCNTFNQKQMNVPRWEDDDQKELRSVVVVDGNDKEPIIFETFERSIVLYVMDDGGRTINQLNINNVATGKAMKEVEELIGEKNED
jgi:hypothetical protein